MYTSLGNVLYLFLEMDMSDIMGILIIANRIIKSYYKEVG